MFLTFLFIGRSLRRKVIGSSTTISPAAPSRRDFQGRVKIYAVVAAVTAISAVEQARSIAFKSLFGASTRDIFFWNFGACAILLAITELVLWLRRR